MVTAARRGSRALVTVIASAVLTGCGYIHDGSTNSTTGVTLPALGSFNITGITALSDSVQDSYLNGSTLATVNWSASAGASSYDVTIYQSNGVGVQCATQSTTATSYNFSTCALTAGQSYKVKVTAKNGADTATKDAANSLYGFLVNSPPTVGTLPTYYVMMNGSVAISALTDGSPTAACGLTGCTLAVATAANGTNGTTSANSTTITYTPNANYTGTDSFIYSISDGRGGTATGVINIKVVTAYTWSGGGTDANWTTAANWCGAVNSTHTGCSGGSAPGSSNLAIFDDTCSSNCSPAVNASISVGGLSLNQGYSGTVTQASGSTMTIGSSGYTQAAGTFNGSNAGDAMTLNAPFTLSGGTFRATSGTLTVGRSWTVSNSPTFSSNSGLIKFFPCAYCSEIVTPGTISYGSVSFTQDADTYSLNSGTMTITGNLSFDTGGEYAGLAINSGTLDVAGNVTSNVSAGASTATIVLTGNVSGQTISMADSSCSMPALDISTATNPVTLSGLVSVSGFTVTSVGTFTTTGSTLKIEQLPYTNITVNPGTVTYNNVSFVEDGANISLGGATMIIAGDLTFDTGGYSGASVDSGTLDVAGNVTSNVTAGGTASIVLTGNASGQTISMADSSCSLPALDISAGTNPVTLSGTVRVWGLTMSSVGTFTTTGSTLQIEPPQYTSITVTPGTVTYNNVSFLENGAPSISLGGATITIAGNLTFDSSGRPGLVINSGTLEVAGNVAANVSTSGNAALTFYGSANQSFTAVSSVPSGTVTINKSGGYLNLASNISEASTDWVVTAGTIYLSGFNLSIFGLSLNGNTIHLEDPTATSAAGTLTVNGSPVSTGSYFGGTIAN